jgi:hypothetical protein
MATTETAICNLALQKMGQLPITSIDSATDILSIKCHNIFDQCRDELLISGPRQGWKFAKMTYHDIDVNSYSITAFALATATTTTVTATHGLVAGDMVTIDGTTNYDGEYKVESVSTTVSFVITKTFVATETGTAYWTSDDYEYRYAIPTCKKVISVRSGGIDLTDWVRQGDWILTNQESSEVDMTIIKAITDVTLFPDWFVRVLSLKLAIELTYNLTQDLKSIQLLGQELDLAMDKAVAMDESEKYVKEYSTDWVDAGR